MFYHYDEELIRQKYQAYNAQFDGPYVPRQDAKPGVIRRLLALLRGTPADPTPQPIEPSQRPHSHAGAAAR